MKLEFNIGYHLEAFFYNLIRSTDYFKDRQVALRSSSEMTNLYREDPKFSKFLNDLHHGKWRPELRKL